MPCVQNACRRSTWSRISKSMPKFPSTLGVAFGAATNKRRVAPRKVGVSLTIPLVFENGGDESTGFWTFSKVV